MITMISLLYFLFSTAVVQTEYTDILDLTVGDKIISSANMRWGGGGGSNFSRHIVSVAIKFDKDRYVMGEEFIYEISIKNVSGEEIHIPWDTDGDKINNGNESYSYKDLPAGFMRAYACISHGNPLVATLPLEEPIVLYGSDAFAASIKKLKPEESVMIRAAGHWNKDRIPTDELANNSNKIVKIYARWHFSYGIDVMKYKQSTDSEPMEIELIIPPDEKEN